MTGAREIVEMGARAIGIIQFYYGGQKSKDQKALMDSEIKTIAKWFLDRKVTDIMILERVMKTVESELIDRYGAKTGSQLYVGFMESFCAPKESKQKQ